MIRRVSRRPSLPPLPFSYPSPPCSRSASAPTPTRTLLTFDASSSTGRRLANLCRSCRPQLSMPWFACTSGPFNCRDKSPPQSSFNMMGHKHMCLPQVFGWRKQNVTKTSCTTSPLQRSFETDSFHQQRNHRRRKNMRSYQNKRTGRRPRS